MEKSQKFQHKEDEAGFTKNMTSFAVPLKKECD